LKRISSRQSNHEVSFQSGVHPPTGATGREKVEQRSVRKAKPGTIIEMEGKGGSESESTFGTRMRKQNKVISARGKLGKKSI